MVILCEVYKYSFTFLVRVVSSHIVWSGLLHYVRNVFWFLNSFFVLLDCNAMLAHVLDEHTDATLRIGMQ